ncbi:hypothetical protein WJX79_006392 [Trebouxia sp. C0005]
MMVSRQLVESQAYIHEEHELVNRFVSKLFPGYPASFDGKIIHYNASLCPKFPFHVKYNDGDEEDITEAEARQIVNAGYHGASRHHSQDLVSNNSRPLAEACNSAGEGYSVSAHSDMHCLQKRAVGRATKLTTANGPPGQITLVRSPNGVKRTAVQLTEPEQQRLQQQHPMDVAREVDNAVDNSDNQESDVPHRGNNNAAGQVKSSKDAGHAASAAEDYAASECGEPNSPEHVSKSKSLNAFMAAKLADAVSKGTSEGKAKKRQRQESDDEESRCTVSDTEMTNGGDEGSNAPSRGNGRGRGRSSRGGRGPTEAGSGRGGRGSRGKGGRGGQDRKALPMVPGQKKKRGRPSKQDIAERQAYQAAVEAEEARHATAAPPDHDLPHQPLKASRGDASAAAAQQHDNEERRNIQHKPRTSRTSPATQLPQKEATAQEQQAQTGDSRARTGNTQPKGRRPGATGVTGSPASDRHTEGSTQNASPAASEEDRRGHQHQQQQQQQHHRPTSSVSEQGLNSAAGNNKSHLPGGTSGNNMAIVAAEAPESSSHTGRQGALVVQPQNDAACPAWFSGFMQMNQSANQNVDDKLTIMAGKQDTTLAAVQGMQKSQGIITKVGRKHINMGGLYKKARRWRVEERHRFISNQLYPNDSDSGLGYREQFQQVLGQLDDCLEEAGIHRGHVTEVRVHMLNLEKGQKHVSQVFDDWTDGLPDFGPMLKFTSGKTGHEDVKLLMEASALVPPEAQHLHGGPPIVTSKPMEIDNK